MPRLNSGQTKRLILDNMPFMGNNCFGEQVKGEVQDLYAVYSYGRHYPMFIKLSDKWYVNSDKSSRTTERQKAELLPVRSDYFTTDTSGMKAIIRTKSVRGVSLVNYVVARRRRTRVR